MPRASSNRLHLTTVWTLIFVTWLTVRAPFFALAQSAEEPALRILTEKFFTAYQNSDLDVVMSLWSEKSPELDKSRQGFQRIFNDNKIEVKSVDVRRIIVRSAKAKVRVVAHIVAADAKTGKPAASSGIKRRTLHCVKEGDLWKIWKYGSSEEDLAISLGSVKTNEERKALIEAEKELMTAELVQELQMEGRISYGRGNYPEAIDFFTLQEDVAIRISDKKGTIDAQRYIGIAHSSLSNYPEALAYSQKSLHNAEQAQYKEGITSALNQIGRVHNSVGNNKLALEFFQKSLNAAQETDDKDGLARALNNIGNTHYAQNNYAQALDYYQQTLKIFEATNSGSSSGGTLNNIGNVHFSQGDYDKALTYYEKSLELMRKRGFPDAIAVSLNNIGNVYYGKNSYKQALDYYRESLLLSEGTVNKELIVSTLSGISQLHASQGNYDQAIEVSNRANALAEQVGLQGAIWQLRFTSGKSYRALNRPEQARQSFDLAIASIEGLRTQVAGDEQDRQRFFEGKIGPYYEMIQLLIDRNDYKEAFAYAERAKARALLDALQNGRVNITKAMTVDEQESERKHNSELVSLNAQMSHEKLRKQPEPSRLAQLNSQLEKARLDYEAFNLSLYAAHPELKVHRGQMQPISLDDASKLIPDANTALLEYVVTENKAYLFVLTRERQRKGNSSGLIPAMEVYTLNIKQKELGDQVERFRKMIADTDIRIRKPARELFELLLNPAADRLRGKTQLIIVPDGTLWDLPFQAMQSARGRYLIEDYSVAYVPSLSALREMSKRRNKSRQEKSALTLLALGNPALGKSTISTVKNVSMQEWLYPLPSAEKQVRDLGKLYGAGQSKIYVGVEASEERFKAEAPNYRILHLATHGILNDRNPMYSYLLLSQKEGSKKEDGMLEAWELMKLDLKANMAVLSACETARGRAARGEGMIGLSWALFVAGVPTTVVSQWKVESVRTAELMVEFHRRMKSRAGKSVAQASKAEALRKASLNILRSKQYSHPFYWGGFIVVGDGF